MEADFEVLSVPRHWPLKQTTLRAGSILGCAYLGVEDYSKLLGRKNVEVQPRAPEDCEQPIVIRPEQMKENDFCLSDRGRNVFKDHLRHLALENRGKRMGEDTRKIIVELLVNWRPQRRGRVLRQVKRGGTKILVVVSEREMREDKIIKPLMVKFRSIKRQVETEFRVLAEPKVVCSMNPTMASLPLPGLVGSMDPVMSLFPEDSRGLLNVKLQAMLCPLNSQEEEMVRRAMYGTGRADGEVVAKIGADTVQLKSFRRLEPGQWLNDEVIHMYCGNLLATRDLELCRQQTGKRRSHFFQSFFMSMLLNENHEDSNRQGLFEYWNVRRWSRNVPGGDIFKLDKVVFPINHAGCHWVCVVAFMQEKRIQLYDSFGSDELFYVNMIFQYLQEEHMSKKNKPLGNLDMWKLQGTSHKIPRQRNGKLARTFI